MAHFFRLRPSVIPNAGVGVFTLQFIAQGTLLPELFVAEDCVEYSWAQFAALDVPEELKENFVVRYEDCCYLPRDLQHPSLGWYLNDSETPNLAHTANYDYYATRDIAAGEELLIRYDDL